MDDAQIMILKMETHQMIKRAERRLVVFKTSVNSNTAIPQLMNSNTSMAKTIRSLNGRN